MIPATTMSGFDSTAARTTLNSATRILKEVIPEEDEKEKEEKEKEKEEEEEEEEEEVEILTPRSCTYLVMQNQRYVSFLPVA